MRLTKDGLPKVDFVWWWRSSRAHLYLRPQHPRHWLDFRLTYTVAADLHDDRRFWRRIHWSW
jgi:hypothetical protein